MSGNDLVTAQNLIRDYIKATLNWPVETGGVPDATTVRQVNGVVDPYVVLRFSDQMPASGDGSFGGARYDGYYSYLDAICVCGPDKDISDGDARALMTRVNRILLGQKFENTGQLSKAYGGGVFVLPQNNSIPLAYLGICSFRFNVNVEDVGAV